MDGYDHSKWLPGSTQDASPAGHSFFYVGFHYLFLYFLKWIGISDPQAKMLLVRLIHAAYSLLTIVLGYKIALRIHNIRSARLVGLLLSIYWLMPFLSVPNLVEVVCVPPMLPIVSTMYSKKARVESMTYLSKYEDIGFILSENTNKDDTKMIPKFYLGEWVRDHEITKEIPIEWHIDNKTLSGEGVASFVLFFEADNIGRRAERLKEVMPGLVFEKKIEPGFADKIMHWMNPVNANNIIYIYRNTDKIPDKKP
ncbi:MAG: hypothetical protein U5Q03_05025 [Bacteroidota bacterium]|nr:hypothetical protein [Bacteroidota bacterium]